MSFTAISAMQPHPWLMLRPDVSGAEARLCLQRDRLIKDVDCRDWETPHRGWALVHASKERLAKWDYQAEALFAAKRGVEVPLRDNHVYGAVVGAVKVVDCTWSYRSPWWKGGMPRGFVLGAAVPFAVPVECAGKPRFFQLPPEGAGDGGLELWQRLAAAIYAAGLAAEFKIDVREIRTAAAPAERREGEAQFLL